MGWMASRATRLRLYERASRGPGRRRRPSEPNRACTRDPRHVTPLFLTMSSTVLRQASTAVRPLLTFCSKSWLNVDFALLGRLARSRAQLLSPRPRWHGKVCDIPGPGAPPPAHGHIHPRLRAGSLHQGAEGVQGSSGGACAVSFVMLHCSRCVGQGCPCRCREAVLPAPDSQAPRRPCRPRVRALCIRCHRTRRCCPQGSSGYARAIDDWCRHLPRVPGGRRAQGGEPPLIYRDTAQVM